VAGNSGGSAVSNEWKGMLHPLGFFPHRRRGETSQVKGHRLMSMMSFAKNCRSSGSSGHVVCYLLSTSSNMGKPTGGLLWRQNKALCPLPLLLITTLLPIC